MSLHRFYGNKRGHGRKHAHTHEVHMCEHNTIARDNTPARRFGRGVWQSLFAARHVQRSVVRFSCCDVRLARNYL